MAFSLIPRNYGGFPQMFYPPYQTPRYGHYDARFIRKAVPRPPIYPIRPHRPFPMYTRGKHLTAGFHRPTQPGPSIGWPVHTNPFDRRYWKYLNRKQSHQGKQRLNNGPAPYFNTMPKPYFTPGKHPKLFQNGREPQQVPFPVIKEQTTTFGGSVNLGNMTAGVDLTLAPKIRVIFIPTVPPPVPQISIGPLVTCSSNHMPEEILTEVLSCISDDATISVQSCDRRCVSMAHSTAVTAGQFIALDTFYPKTCDGTVC